MSALIPQFRAAKRASTPLIAIHTADPAATMTAIRTSFNGTPPAMLHWDCVCGIRPVNKAGEEVVGGITSPATLIGPVDALLSICDVPEGTITFMANMHRVINEPGVSQAVWNLRDPYKRNQRTLVMLCPSMELPVELQQDVICLDEPLPTAAQLTDIVKDMYKSASIAEPEDLSKPVDAICGLAAFPAEQVCAISMGKSGLNLDTLWERKRQAIEQTPGLSVWRGGESFDAIGGCANAKTFMRAILAGNEPPRAIVFIDEIEKQMAGAGSDTSGVATDMHGALLTWMQDHRANGSIFIGPPGAAKSVLAKATGNAGGIPTIAFDLGAMKSSLVGESGARLRNSLKVIQSISQGQAYFIATSNSIDSISPELRRRFKSGTFFFDLPSEKERSAIWAIYVTKFSLSRQDLPADEGWTGSEIETCCELSWRLKISLKAASNYIVPVAKSDAQRIKSLRQQADGRFISASYPGVYQVAKETSTGRRLEL